MCNLYQLEAGPDAIRRIFESVHLPLGFPEGVPNFEPRDIHITDRAPIVRAGASGVELVERRWSWPLATGKPLYNMRSEGRSFDPARCLAIASGFYEYSVSADPKQKRKDRWLFRPVAGELLGIAAIWRTHPQVGEAFTLLTAEPGPDVAPLHHRQIILLDASDWAGWLDGSDSSCLARRLDAGTLSLERA